MTLRQFGRRPASQSPVALTIQVAIDFETIALRLRPSGGPQHPLEICDLALRNSAMAVEIWPKLGPSLSVVTRPGPAEARQEG